MGGRDTSRFHRDTSRPLDTGSVEVHTLCVGSLPNRLNIPDARGRGASLQVTSHSGQRKVVLSHWRDGICVASTPVDLSELPALIGVLAEALGDAASTAPASAAEGLTKPTFWHRWKENFRPALGKIVELPHARGHQREAPPGD